MIAAAANDNVSPELVVFEAVNAPHSHRFGVPAESHVSIPTMVAAGMFVCEHACTFDVPDEGASNTAVMPVAATYEPPEANSVPFAVAEPFAVISRIFNGDVAAVSDAFAWIACKIS